MYNLFKLIRINNLAMIAVTQYLIRFCVLAPILHSYKLSLQMSELWFAMLVLSTVLIAAGGYAINDYFDTKTDQINRPGRVLVGKTFSRQFAIKIHFALSTAGALLGIATAFYVGEWKLFVIFPLVSAMLWFYSTTFKGQLLIGNIIISALTAMVPMMVLIFEAEKIAQTEAAFVNANLISFNVANYWVAGFALFAFITNFIREVVKDMEDYEGDSETGRVTVPIAWGIKNSQTIVALLAFIEVAFIAVIFYRHLKWISDPTLFWISLGYVAAALIIPFMLLLALILTAKSKKDYTRASFVIKLLMLSGVLYTVIFYLSYTSLV